MTKKKVVSLPRNKFISDAQISPEFSDPSKDPECVAFMVVSKKKDGHIHVHAPFEDMPVMHQLLEAVELEMIKHRNRS